MVRVLTSHQCGPGSNPGVERHIMWVEFVVGSLLYSERFFSGYSSFPLSSKTNISKFQFNQESGRRRTTLWMCYLQIIIYCLFIYLFIYVCKHFTLTTRFSCFSYYFGLSDTITCTRFLLRQRKESNHFGFNHYQIIT